MSKIIIKGRKKVIALSVLNKTYYLNLFFVNAVMIEHLKIKKTFDDLNKEERKEVKRFLRNLVIREDRLSNTTIEESILASFLPKDAQNLLYELDKKDIKNNF